MTSTQTRIDNYRRLEKEKREILAKMETPEAREDGFWLDQLGRELSSINDEIGYWRTVR